MRALIVGGGVAGPATALALQAVGIDSVVLEARRPEELAQGSYLTLAPNGVHALGELGLLEAAREDRLPVADQRDGRGHRARPRHGHPRPAPGRRHAGA